MRHLIAAWLVMWCTTAWAATLELVVATNEYPPYVSANPRQSFMTELFELIGKDMDVRFTFRFMPWKRCVVALDAHEVWAVVPFVPTPERVERYLLSDTLYARRAKFFYYDHGSRNWPAGYKDLSELRRFRIGGVAGYWYESLFKDAGIELDMANNDQINFRKLQVARFDLVIVDENVGNYIAHTQFTQQAGSFHSLDTPYFRSENVMMANRDPANTELLARFNRALERLRKSGAYDDIVNRRKLVLMPSGAAGS
ncbi:substrate-binding periplasmic protein [Duganella aquatilis]|nr:transporter substrate-binding domain-containing protein [Duganella aquatilis]